MNHDAQKNLEETYSKYQLMPVLRSEFGEIVEGFDDPDWGKFVVDVLCQIYLHRQADVTTMVGVLYPVHGETPQIVADKLLVAAEEDYIDFDEDRQRFSVIYDLTDDVVSMLDKYQYPLPMITPPLPVKYNNQTGYVTIHNSVVLNTAGSDYFDDKDMCLDHLNRANSVPLTLDADVIKSPEGRYSMPKRKSGEDFNDFQKRLRQATIFYDTSLKVMDEVAQLSDQIFLTHRFDRRGRCYSSGYHINTQGTDYNKAVLQLANKEVLS